MLKISLTIAAFFLSACGLEPMLTRDPYASNIPTTGIQREDSKDVAEESGACVSTYDFFVKKSWPQAVSSCATCHTAAGFYTAMGGSLFVLANNVANQANLDVMKQLAVLNSGAQPLLLVKASGGANHQGGAVLPISSEGYASLLELIERIKNPITCDTPASNEIAPEAITSGTNLLSAEATLRKATIKLAGRIPTAAEETQVTTNGISALDSILLNLMTEPSFYNQLKIMFNDLLHTDGNLSQIIYDTIINSLPAGRNFPLTWGSYPGYLPYNDLNTAAANSFAQEPLEIIARTVRLNRPFTDILLGRYRLINRLGAEVLNLNPSTLGFTGAANDYSEFVEVQLPNINGEYAGILTTTSFLIRYPDTDSNRNRKRARYFYQFFLDYDVMKTSVPIDLSLVNFQTNPWRNNSQCTGCHAIIDPVAGAFQNWTTCYVTSAIYQPVANRHCGVGGWFAAENMFTTGTGPESLAPGAVNTNKLTGAELLTPLEHLASATVQKREFARSMVRHVFAELTGIEDFATPAGASQNIQAAYGQAAEAKEATINTLTDKFIAANFNFKNLIIDIIKSSHFRISNADRRDRLELLGLGSKQLTPEVLNDQIISTFGYPWGKAASQVALADPIKPRRHPYYLLDKFKIFAGGIDSLNVMNRTTEPTTLFTSVAQLMANEMSCEYTAVDFSQPNQGLRVLFPHVNPNMEPSEANKPTIVQNIQYLHKRFLGENLAANDPEVEHTYSLLTQAWQTGKAAIAGGTMSNNLTTECRADTVYSSGAASASTITTDPTFMMRAWQAVLIYLSTDFRFLNQ